MPTDGSTQTYGFLDQLSIEQLLDLMREDLESPEGGDGELTSRILEVIEKREKENPTGLFSDVDQAWEDFQNYYNTPDSEDCPMAPMRDFSPSPKTAWTWEAAEAFGSCGCRCGSDIFQYGCGPGLWP